MRNTADKPPAKEFFENGWHSKSRHNQIDPRQYPMHGQAGEALSDRIPATKKRGYGRGDNP